MSALNESLLMVTQMEAPNARFARRVCLFDSSRYASSEFFRRFHWFRRSPFFRKSGSISPGVLCRQPSLMERGSSDFCQLFTFPTDSAGTIVATTVRCSPLFGSTRVFAQALERSSLPQ